jgi:hypothetical protein
VITIASFDTEIEAELARGALESNGIIALVRFAAPSGYPSYAAGSGGFGVGAPLSRYDVLVPEDRAEEARGIVGAREPRGSHPGAWRTWLFRAFTLFVLFAFLWTALEQLRLLF